MVFLKKGMELSGFWNISNPNQFMHQNQILDILRISSKTIHSQWTVLEDLPIPSKIRFDAGLDGVRSSNTIHWLCMVLEDLPRPSKIWFWCINWFGFIAFFLQRYSQSRRPHSSMILPGTIPETPISCEWSQRLEWPLGVVPTTGRTPTGGFVNSAVTHGIKLFAV